MAENVVSPKVASYIERVTGALNRAKEKAGEQKEALISGASSIAGAYGAAYVVARYPERKVAGVDADTVGAVVFGVGAAFTSGMSQMVLGGLSTGCACAVAARMASAKGSQDRAIAAAAGK